ncbi:plasmid mobilization relaxosome protein MobC [Clostridiales bacterium]|nr:plasmid mobilization relaxosome protein MobC [Clostridiales bacterium]
MARPTKEKELSRSRHVTLRLTETQHEALTHAAKQAKLSRSEYIRQQLLNGKVAVIHDFRVDLPELQKLTSEFHNIGNNLNQIARHLNAGGGHTQETHDRVNQCVSQLFELRKEVLRMAGDFHSAAKSQQRAHGGRFHGDTETHREQKR